MNEAVIADVQRHVRGFAAFLREEQEVAALQFAAQDRARHAPQLVGAVRQIYAATPVTVLNETAAIEAGRGVAAVSVGFADHGQREIRRAVSGRLGWILNGNVSARRQGVKDRYHEQNARKAG